MRYRDDTCELVESLILLTGANKIIWRKGNKSLYEYGNELNGGFVGESHFGIYCENPLEPNKTMGTYNNIFRNDPDESELINLYNILIESIKSKVFEAKLDTEGLSFAQFVLKKSIGGNYI